MSTTLERRRFNIKSKRMKFHRRGHDTPSGEFTNRACVAVHYVFVRKAGLTLLAAICCCALANYTVRALRAGDSDVDTLGNRRKRNEVGR